MKTLSNISVALIFCATCMQASYGQDFDTGSIERNSKRISVEKVVLIIETTTTDGRTVQMRSEHGNDVKSVIRKARAFVVDSFMIGSTVPDPLQAIFKCGGSSATDPGGDGTCNDVIASCATLDVEFECNKYDDEGICTNGSC